MDAANVDLKAFTERFYGSCASHLAPVLDTLAWLKHETRVWLEVTTLLIPGDNDSEAELARLVAWIVEHLGPDVPLHFSAFHPDFKLTRRAAHAAGHAAARAAASRCARGCTTCTRATCTTWRARPRAVHARLRCAGHRARLVLIGG
jgi:pyruvate-formate lyase-activating enzyme